MKYPPYPEHKPSGVEWLGDVPKHWQIKRLDFVASVKARLGWKGLTADEYVPKGYIFLATPNIKGEGPIDFVNVNYITHERYLESPEIMLCQGDVLIAKDGSTLGITNLVRQLPSPATVNSSIAIIRLRRAVLPEYLFRWLTSVPIQALVNRMKGGQGVPHLFQADIRKFPVLVPPEKEQSRIVEFLRVQITNLDQLCLKKQALIEKLKEKRAALISRTVTRGLPPDAARAAGLDPHPALKPSGVEWMGDTPKHWLSGNLRRFAVMKTGHTPSRQHPEYWDDCDIPWFTLADVWQLRDGKRRYLGETKERISRIGLQNSAAELLPAGTVILSRTASVGYAGIMPEAMATTQDFWNWVCSDRLRPEYLLLLFWAMKPDFERLSMGSTHKTIYQPVAASISVSIPPLIAEQEAIIQYVDRETAKIDRMVAKVEEAIERLREYRAALITAAVTGKIDVRGYAPVDPGGAPIAAESAVPAAALCPTR